MTISFARPELLGLLLLVPLVWFVPRRVRDVSLGALRSLVLALVVLALAGPVTVRDGGETHLVVVLDATASGGDTAAARAAVRSARAESSADRSTLVVVGDPKGPDEGIFDTVIRMAAGDSTSPLGDALAAAARAIPRGAEGAICLVTDGMATRRDWAREAQALSKRGVPVTVVALTAALGDVRPVGMTVPSDLRVGHSGRVFVDVVGGPARVRVRLDGPSGELAASAPMVFEDRTRVRLEVEPREAGILPITATVELVSGADRNPANNTMTRPFAVQEPLRVAWFGKRVQGGADKLRDLVGPGFEIVEGGDRADADSLAGYDMIMLDDRPAESLDDATQQAMIEAVQRHGTGLFMSGGAGSFGPGGYHETPVASILPVEFIQKEEKKDPSTSLAVIIDTSGSMGGNRIILAKEVTRLAIRRLLPHDKVGIVEFYGNKRWAAPLQSAANAIDIQRALNRLDAGGGTILFPAIEEAYYGLRNVQTRYKHVLVLTDAGVEEGPYETLLRRMARDGICVSTVLVGPGRHSEFLVQMADWGNGRYYNASNRFNLPEIMLKQPSTSRLPAYRRGVHQVQARGGQGWWGPTNPANVPPLAGYVETRSRPGAEVVLETRTDRHPIVASWQHGLGRVTALTTEPAGEGTRPWQSWSDYGAALARLLSRTAGESRQPFTFDLAREGHLMSLTAKRRIHGDVRPSARVVDGAAGIPVAFDELAPGLFEARWVTAPERGVEVEAGTDDLRRRVTWRGVSAPHADVSAETQVDPASALDLGRLAAATGGRVIAPGNPVEASFGGGAGAVSATDQAPWCLLAALLVWLGELAWRRSPWRGARDAA